MCNITTTSQNVNVSYGLAIAISGNITSTIIRNNINVLYDAYGLAYNLSVSMVNSTITGSLTGKGIVAGLSYQLFANSNFSNMSISQNVQSVNYITTFFAIGFIYNIQTYTISVTNVTCNFTVDDNGLL